MRKGRAAEGRPPFLRALTRRRVGVAGTATPTLRQQLGTASFTRGSAAHPCPDRDRRRRHRRRGRRLSPRRAGRDRRAGGRPGAVVRDRRVYLARAGHHLPDERVPHDVPYRAGHRRALRLAAARRRAGLVRCRRPRGRDHRRADGGAEAPPGVRARLRARGHRAPVAGRVRRALAAARPLDGAGRLLGPHRRRRQGRQDREALRGSARGRRRPVRRRRDGHGVRHRPAAGSTRSRPRRVASSASACCCAPASGARRSGRWRACRSRWSPCSTSWSGPTRSPSWRARTSPSSRSCAIRTCRCTSASATTTSASATTGTSRSSPRRRPSAHPAARCSPR